MTPEQELLTILNQLPAAIEKAFTEACILSNVEGLVLRHPGHANQKTHGNRFGAGQAKESLRRLKDDKGAREKYKTAARGRGQGSGASSESQAKNLKTDRDQRREARNTKAGELRKKQDELREQMQALPDNAPAQTRLELSKQFSKLTQDIDTLIKTDTADRRGFNSSMAKLGSGKKKA